MNKALFTIMITTNKVVYGTESVINNMERCKIMNNIKDEIIAILCEITEQDLNSDALNMTFEELDINSVGFIRLVVECETKFNIRFDDDRLAIEKFTDVNEFVKYAQSVNDL